MQSPVESIHVTRWNKSKYSMVFSPYILLHKRFWNEKLCNVVINWTQIQRRFNRKRNISTEIMKLINRKTNSRLKNKRTQEKGMHNIKNGLNHYIGICLRCSDWRSAKFEWWWQWQWWRWWLLHKLSAAIR